MKKTLIFSGILYFIVTFVVGFIIAIFLPPIYLYGDTLLDTMSDCLYEEDYDEAIKLVGGYYNSENVYSTKISEGGLVIYQAATSSNVVENDPNGNQIQVSVLNKVYVGFLYGVQSEYHTNSKYNNRACVKVDVGGTVKDYSILDTDTDGDGEFDSITTYEKRGIIILELKQDDYPQISSLTFIDSEGNNYFKADFNSTLDYSGSFYSDIDPLIEVYGKTEFNEDELLKQEQQFLSNNVYQKSSYKKAEKRANEKATKFVIIYFIIVYVIADFLFTKYLLKLGKLILVKVFKVKFEPKEPKYSLTDNNFGNDYFCSLTISLENEDGEFVDDVTIAYGEGAEQTVFKLTAQGGYQTTEKVKAGVYGSLNITISEEYKVEGLPNELVVQGFKKKINAKIIRQKG